jgi:ElaB/YqjD/DUF883 family membrane-anchored ribosome-binding protein
MGEPQTQNNQGPGLMDRLRDGAASQLGTQKDRATDGVTSVAQAVRQSTQQLRENRHETIAQYVDQAVDGVERFANRLKDKNVNELVRDAQQFARRNPAVFVGTAFGIGVVAARFLKSSNRGNAGDYGGWRERTSGYNAAYGSTAQRDYQSTGGSGRTSGSTAGSERF